MSKRKTISEDGKTYKILSVLCEDAKAIVYLAECEGDTCVLALPKEPKSRAKKSNTAKPAEKKPALSELNENTLVHYASSDPYKGSSNTLHISSDCPKLSNAWAIFQQPLFEVKMQRDRRWRLCPTCANAEPMLFVPKKRHWLFSPSINLKIINKRK